MSLLEMPEVVRELARPWASLVGTLEGSRLNWKRNSASRSELPQLMTVASRLAAGRYYVITCKARNDPPYAALGKKRMN
jgi:hypothetical protein